MQEYEFKIELPDGTEVVDRWVGGTMEQAAKRLLACKYPTGKIVAWRSPSHVVTTVPLRGC